MKASELTVSIQRGHCFRTRGSTGTHREQEFTNRLGHEMSRQFNSQGIKNHLLTADEWIPPCDLFIALHIDGSSNSGRRGCSVGYPSDSSVSRHSNFARTLKRNYGKIGYTGGYLPDNYTRNLRYYYGFNKVRADVEVLFEHGFGTNPTDEAWMFGNLVKIAKFHVDTAKEFYNIQDPPQPSTTQPWPGRYLKITSPFMRGLDAAWVQLAINDILNKKALDVDGIYGRDTEAQVISQQKFFKLIADGVVGPKTWGLLDYIRSIR